MRKTNDENQPKPGSRSTSQDTSTDNPVDLKLLIENVPGIVYRVHLKEEFRMEFFNDMLESMTGYKAFELKRGEVCSIDPLILPEDRPGVMDIVKGAIKGNDSFEVEYRLRHKNGSIRHFLERGRPVSGCDGEPAFIDGVILDITARKQTEEALRESEERFRSVLENSLDAAYRRDLKTDRYDYVSPIFEKIIGFTPDEMRNLNSEEALQRVHPEDRQHVVQELERNLNGGKQLLEYRFKGKDGEYRWLADSISLLEIRDEHLSYRVGVVRDVTAQKQAEVALKEYQSRLLQVTENIKEVFWLTNPDWTELFYVSSGYEKVWWRSCESLCRQPLSWFEAVVEEDRPAILTKLEEGFDQGVMTLPEYRIVRPDGTQRYIQDRAWPIRDERGNIRRLAGIAEDITERKRAEDALRESEAKYRSLFENSLDAIFLSVPVGKIVAANPAACATFGMTEQEIIQVGRDGLIDPSDPRHDVALEERARSGKVYAEVRYHRKDGTTFEAEVSSVLLSGGKKAFVMIRDITERKLAEEALRRSHEDLEVRVQERTAELSLTNRALGEYAAKLERLNQELQEFAFVASHDLQEPLRKIQVFGDLLKDEDALSEEKRHDYFERMQSASARMRTMIDGLLAYSRVTTKGQPSSEVSLSEAAMKALEMVNFMVRETSAVVEVGDLPSAEADRSQMVQLFHNLLENALKFRQKDRSPVIRIYSESARDGWERIMVEDNGIGFEETHLERIFVPFQRLHGKGTYAGVGIGLSVCKRIVERHGGAITAKSLPGKGSTFIIELPVKQGRSE